MGYPSPDNMVTIPQNAKRVPVTIPGSAVTTGSLLLALLTAAGYDPVSDGGIIGFQIEANQPGVVTDRLDFFMANTNTAAAFIAHGVYVKAGIAYKSYAAGEISPGISQLAVVSATVAAVPAIVTLYLMMP